MSSEFDEERDDFDDGCEYHDDNEENQYGDDGVVDEVDCVQCVQVRTRRRMVVGGSRVVVVVQVQNLRVPPAARGVRHFHV